VTLYPVIILLLCCAVIALAVGATLLFARKRRSINVWSGVMVLGAGAWSLLMLAFMLQFDPMVAAICARAYYVTAIVMAFGLYNFAMQYPLPRMAPWWERSVAWFFAIAACVVSATPQGIVTAVEVTGTFNTASLNTPWYIAYIAVFAFLVCAAFVRLVQSYMQVRKTRAKKYAHQVLMIIYTLGIVVVSGTYFDILLPLAGNYQSIWMGPPFTFAFTGYLLYVLTTQGVFDVRAALARSIGYVAIAAVIVVLYGALIFGVGGVVFGNSQPSVLQQLFYLGSALALAFSVGPLRALLDKLTYRFFYHRDYNFNDVLQQFSTVTANEIELNRVISKSLTVLLDALAPSYVSLYIMSSHGRTHHYVRNLKGRRTPRHYRQQLEIVKDILADLPRTVRVSDIVRFEARQVAEDSGAQVIVQLMVKGEQVGVVFFGERQNGLPYSEQDMQLLATTADELALAVQNGLRFDEIKSFNKRLRKEVNTATRELRHSNAQLHKIDEVKDEFLSIASHQLRTPLTSVKGYVSLVLDGDAGPVNAQQRHLLNEAFASSQRMVSLIEDFLNMSRLQTGRFVIDKQPSDIVAMIGDEVNVLRSTAEARSLKLDFRKTGQLPSTVVADEGKLRQVVMNFIDNAIYYSNENSTIKIRLSRKDNSLVFEVRDTGIGVPADAQPQLFSKFYRASNARNRRPDGTGVGLYLAKMVVTEHGGEIIFDSTEGKGSTFGFSLPLADSLDADENKTK
jgi:signal transduction histidine kinase